MKLREIRKNRKCTQQMVADYFGVTVDYLLGRKEFEMTALSPYEQKLVEAARKSDDRAREDALLLLQQHADYEAPVL